jgi:hypothetical protein
VVGIEENGIDGCFRGRFPPSGGENSGRHSSHSGCIHDRRIPAGLGTGTP